MRNILLILAVLLGFSSCKKDDNFMDKFSPEILFYPGDRVENPDFTNTTLAAGVTEFTVKARVSAPVKLKEVKLYQNDALLETYTDFSLSPNVYNLKYVVKAITAETKIRVDAVDLDGKPTSRTFLIKVTP